MTGDPLVLVSNRGPVAYTWTPPGVLPPGMREALFDGVLGNDVVAFHSRFDARNFLLSAARSCSGHGCSTGTPSTSAIA